MTTARCKSCNAPIVWAWMPTGSTHPFEVADDGIWQIDGDHARKIAPEAPPAQIDLFGPPPAEVAKKRTRYVSHFARCPQATRWRSPR